MIIYIFFQALIILIMTKQGHMKYAFWVDNSIVWLKEAPNILLNKNNN